MYYVLFLGLEPQTPSGDCVCVMSERCVPLRLRNLGALDYPNLGSDIDNTT